MIRILKPVFDWITGNYSLFDNPLYNFITMGIIGLIAFAIAWKTVGVMYREGIISSSGVGSIFHWIIRLIIVSFLFLVISFVMWIIKLLISIPIWAYILLVVLGVGIIAIKIRNKKAP